MTAPAVPAIPIDPLEPNAVLVPKDDQSLTDSLYAFAQSKTPRGWWLLFLPALGGAGLLVTMITITVIKGIGMWGNNIPVGWAWDITNFVWWIGIGHAGTLISAILLLFLQRWRTSINRFTEAMTLFAVMCAGIYPVLHLGRPWYAFYLFPYPSRLYLWPQFKSPLIWDVFAVSTYLTVSFLFWFLGLVPDLAGMRDTAKTRRSKVIYGIFALGWRGSARHWNNWRAAYLLLAGLATPLVVSVHTIVSFDFAVSNLPGWHSTFFPPYFVAGAIFSGFAMVLTLVIPARRLLHLEHVITKRHLDNMAKVVLATGWIVFYAYLVEMFLSWYSGNRYEWDTQVLRWTGPFAPIYWGALLCNGLSPQILWSRKARLNEGVLFVVSILVNIGMWCERFMIIATSLSRDFLPSSWREYSPTFVDIGLFIGTIGLFCTAFLLFLKFVPAVSASEVKEMRDELAHEAHAQAHGAHAVATAGGHAP